MKKNLLFIPLLLFSFINAQFLIKGKVENYSNKRILIKLNQGFDYFVAGNLTTDSNGNFSQKVTDRYIGAFYIVLLDDKKNNSFVIISENKDINISFKSLNDKIEFINHGNNVTKAYYDFKNNNSLDYKSYDFLNYYISTEQIPSDKDQITNHFVNAGNYFDTSGLENQLLHNYFKLYYVGNNKADIQINLKKGINYLLEEVGEETTRGQEVSYGMIKLLKAYDFTNLTNYYLKQVGSLSCEISPELKKLIKTTNEITVGRKIPNIKFNKPLNSKYTNLYSIKAPMKLILVWASWCGHCRKEMPQVSQFYENFKKNKGELIALSIDTNKDEWQSIIKNTSWLNYSELLGWDSSFVKDLDITSSPTFILLDKDNNILKITSKISEINNIVK